MAASATTAAPAAIDKALLDLLAGRILIPVEPAERSVCDAPPAKRGGPGGPPLALPDLRPSVYGETPVLEGFSLHGPCVALGVSLPAPITLPGAASSGVWAALAGPTQISP